MLPVKSSLLSLRVLLILPLLALVGPTASAFAAKAQPDAAQAITVNVPKASADFAPGRLIVKIDSTAGVAQTLALLSATRLSLGFSDMTELIAGANEYLLTGGANVDVQAAAERIARLPGVSSASPDYLLHANKVPSDKLYGPNQWYMRTIQAEAGWDITTGSDSIIIAGIDTGVDRNHPDLRGKLLPGFNAITGGDNFQDDNGHGSMTAGLFAAQSNNGEGIAGVCWACKILPVKFLDADGSGPSSAFASAIHWAADHGARVMNISAGSDETDDALQEAINYAYNKGVIIIAAAGNTPDGKPHYPAGYSNVIAVGATANNNTTTGFSSYGPYVDLSAPGVGIISSSWSSSKGSYYDFANGTSFSAPMVAGTVGLMLSINPALTSDQVQAILETSSDDIETPGWDDRSGWGQLNIARALQMVQAGNIPALPQVPVTTTPTPAANATPTQPPTIGGSTIKGKVSGVAPASVQVSLSPQRSDIAPRTTSVGADGSYEFDNLAIGKYTIGLLLTNGGNPPAPAQVEVDGDGATVREVDFDVATGKTTQPGAPTPTPGTGNETGASSPTGPRPAAFDPVAQPAAGFNGQFFPAVGHTLSGAFLTYWQNNGGLAIFGYPLSEPFQEVSTTDNKPYTVQYFERNRFELHPENQAPNNVLLGLLGRTLTVGRNFPAGAPVTQDATHMYFQATQHTLSDQFLAYWQQHGGLAIFGYPISEPMMETSKTDNKQYLVQYFERNRFELHPENAGTPNEVLLGLLGTEVLKARGWR